MFEIGQRRAIDGRQDAGEVDASEVRLQDEPGGLRLLQEVGDLGTAKARVDSDNRCAYAGGGKQQGQPFEAVRQPDRDPRSGTDAGPLQPGCRALHVVGEGGVSGDALALDKADAVWLLLRRVPQQRRQCRESRLALAVPERTVTRRNQFGRGLPLAHR
jgi:hypothetical protein